jgi:polygalacturonase
MKNIILLLLLIIFSTLTTLKCETYNIKTFGALGDGKTVNTLSIQKVINKCRDDGGGTVLIPAGTYISGAIQLYSNIELRLEQGAILKGSDKVSDYFLNGKKVGLIYAENSTNISITGEGNIDGNGDAFMDLNHYWGLDSASVRFTRQKNYFREVLSGVGDGPLAPLDRPYQMIIISNCTNVSIRDVLISNSPFWTVHIADCDGVIVKGIRIWNNLLIPNNDGIDFTSCSNVQMSDCDIRTGDDGIVVTGYSNYYDLPGYKNIRHDSQNVTVTNCCIVSRSSGIRIGCEDQNNMLNYTFSNIVITNSFRGINLCVRDSGSIKGIVFSNIIIQTQFYTGNWWGNGEPIHISVIQSKEKVTAGSISNVIFNNIIAESVAGILLYSSMEGGIKDITFRDVSLYIKNSLRNSTCGGNFDLRPALDPKFTIFSHDIAAFYAENVKNIQLHNVEVKWDEVYEPYFTNGVEFNRFENIQIDGCDINPAPHCKTSAAISLNNGMAYSIFNTRSNATNKQFIIKKNVK